MDKLNTRATLNIDDDLIAQAVELTVEHEKNALVREGLLALVERESAKRLALLGGRLLWTDDFNR